MRSKPSRLSAPARMRCLIDFINVDQAGGDLLPMYEQVCRAIAWTWRNAEKFGGDRERFYISAHSSGSHLAGCALTVGWREQGLPENFCRGALLASGMYDLTPVRLSKRSAYVKFTDAMVEKLSARRHLDGLHTPLVVAHGTCETPEFQRQTRDFAAQVKAAGKPVELLVGEGYNHFEMLETLANPYGLSRPRDAGADAIELKRYAASDVLSVSGLAGFAHRGADQLGAAAAAGINGVFDVGGDRVAGGEDHASCANRAGHHQRGQT